MWAFDATRTNCGTCSHFLFALSATIGRGDQVLASFKPMQCHNWETIVKTDPLHDKSGLSAAMSPAHERGGVCLVDISVYQQCLMRVFARVCCQFRVLCSSSASFSSAIASSFRLLCHKMPLLIHFSFHFHISFILWNCKTKTSPALIKLMFVGFWRDSKFLASPGSKEKQQLSKRMTLWQKILVASHGAACDNGSATVFLTMAQRLNFVTVWKARKRWKVLLKLLESLENVLFAVAQCA